MVLLKTAYNGEPYGKCFLIPDQWKEIFFKVGFYTFGKGGGGNKLRGVCLT